MDPAAFETPLTQLGTLFVLVLTRIGAVVSTAPLLSDTSIPLRAKAAITIAMSVLMTPMAWDLVADAPPNPGTVFQVGYLAVNEAVAGMALGIGLTVVLSGVQLTGQIIGQMSGMALAQSGQSAFGDAASVFGQLYYLVATAVFTASGGLGNVIRGLLDTFHTAPPGSGFATEGVVMSLLGLMSVGFELGVKASAPLLLALFLATIVIGLISRTLPQINTIAIGFGINGLLTLGVMTASLGAVAFAFQAPLANAVDGITGAIGYEAVEVSGPALAAGEERTPPPPPTGASAAPLTPSRNP